MALIEQIQDRSKLQELADAARIAAISRIICLCSILPIINGSVLFFMIVKTQGFSGFFEPLGLLGFLLVAGGIFVLMVGFIMHILALYKISEINSLRIEVLNPMIAGVVINAVVQLGYWGYIFYLRLSSISSSDYHLGHLIFVVIMRLIYWFLIPVHLFVFGTNIFYSFSFSNSAEVLRFLFFPSSINIVWVLGVGVAVVMLLVVTMFYKRVYFGLEKVYGVSFSSVYSMALTYQIVELAAVGMSIVPILGGIVSFLALLVKAVVWILFYVYAATTYSKAAKVTERLVGG